MAFELTNPTLSLIMSMWLPVALMYLGYGEPKGTGAITSFVGVCVVISAFLHSIFGAGAVGALLFAHGLLYCVVGYALLTGLEDLRSVGNTSLVACIISLLFVFIFLGPEGQFTYLSLCSIGYTVLTLEVFLTCYGKFSPILLGWSLLIWAAIGLMIPAFAGLKLWPMPF